MYATHMRNHHKMQWEWCIRHSLANRHLVKLGLIKSERKKTLSIIDHTARNPPTMKEAHREERQSGCMPPSTTDYDVKNVYPPKPTA
ncbi:hypothetical protein EVAR_18442_1 [Eumeta japonica]|uniref:Uncharacterized protein n=1 Tax=Eumeta variegata TaxID=151549 RepID=A0A4C1V1F5_EUMVA|nr:hypothetical protein EVAR_18442_1 [Eumeta japonica]